MATNKPRVTITLDHGVYDTYKQFADAQDKRVSAVLAEMLTECEPQIRSTIAILVSAKEAPKEVLDSIKGVLNEFADQMDKAAGGAQKELNFALRRRS